MVEELVRIVGYEHFFDSSEIVDRYSKDMSFVHPIRPRFVVMPKDAVELREIIEWANKTLTPLIPVSSGPPRFRGDTVPSIEGTVIVDLSRMKNIIRIDVRNRVVLIEPGVTYNELIRALAKENLAPFMPLAPRSTKSVVTSILETEPIITPKYHWNTQDPLRCAEVIFGSGEVLRTGDAVGPGDLEDQWKVGRAQSVGVGPAFVDFSKLLLRAQGTIGIATWCSIGCRRLPKVREAFFVTSQKISHLIELIYKLIWRRLGDACLILNNCNLACLLKVKNEDITALRSDLPEWILIFTIEPSSLLPDVRLEYERNEFVSLARSFGLEPTSQIADIKGEDVLKLVSWASQEPYWKLRWKGGIQELFFITTMNKVPEFISIFYKLADSYGYPIKDIGIYVQPIVQGTSCHCEFDLYYDIESTDETEIVRRILYEGARILAKAGAFFARPYGFLRDITMEYVSEPFVFIQRKIKRIFDPNNIMNPGKLYFNEVT